MVRRKSPRRRATKRTFVISAIEGGAALSLMSKADVATGVQTALGGNIAEGINIIQKAVLLNKSAIIGTLAAAGTAKVLAKSFRVGNVAKLGPVVVRI